MGLFDRLFDRATTSKNTVAQEITNQNRVSPLCSSYENIFSQVRPLIDEMKVVMPYGVTYNSKGEPKRIPESRTPELDMLRNPNDDMGYLEFMDLVYSTWLTEREVNIHVHKNGRRVTGYTVLPVGCRSRMGTGENSYQVTTINGTEFLTDEEVITIRYSRSPRAMDQGVSPATSVEIMAQIDDVLAQYEKAFIENGAIPSSITFITASTKEKYDSKRAKMERNYHGAHNKNKTLFVWRQMLDDGSQANEIEVKPIQGNNSTLAIKEIKDMVNDALNKAVGVSNFIQGDDASAKYDNAELSDHIFTKRRVYPALTMFWSQFQHGLDRIVGGLGYGIDFDLEIPELTERNQAIANIKSTEADTLIKLIQAGASPTGAIKALNLPESWEIVAIDLARQNKENLEQKRLAQTAFQAVAQTETIEQPSSEEKPQETASKDQIEQIAPKCTCKHTKDAGEQPIFAKTEEAEWQIYNALHDLAEKELLGKYPNLTQEEVERAIDELLHEKAILGATDSAKNFAVAVNNKKIAGEIRSVKDWSLSEDFKRRLEERTHDIVGRYIDLCQETKTSTMAIAEAESWTAEQLREKLMDLMPYDRAEMIARNETVHAFRSAGVENTRNLSDKYNLNAYLVWHTSSDGDVCEICAAMEGTKTPAGKAFPTHVTYEKDGQEVEADWGSYFNNDGEEPNAHPNCRCYFTTEIDG